MARVVRWMHGREGWHSEAEAERTVIRHAFRHTKRRERRKRPPRSPRKEREGWHSEAERTVCRHASRPAERRKRSTESAQGTPERLRGHSRRALEPPPPPRPPAHLCTTGMDPSVHARTHACTHARAHTHTYADARTPSPAFLACTPRPERGCPFLACTEGVRAARKGCAQQQPGACACSVERPGRRAVSPHGRNGDARFWRARKGGAQPFRYACSVARSGRRAVSPHGRNGDAQFCARRRTGGRLCLVVFCQLCAQSCLTARPERGCPGMETRRSTAGAAPGSPLPRSTAGAACPCSAPVFFGVLSFKVCWVTGTPRWPPPPPPTVAAVGEGPPADRAAPRLLPRR